MGYSAERHHRHGKHSQHGNESGDSTQPLGNLRNHFLIAMPSLNDSIFSHTITYLCDHSSDGAMGLVINQPLGIDMTEVYKQLNCEQISQDTPAPVLCGGPVQPERGFILHSPEQMWDSSLAVSDEVMLTASRDIIEAMARGEGPHKAQVTLGYAGWGPGQLESEIADNAWLTLPADSRIIFDTPIEQRWAAASQQLGVDMNLISGIAGHA
ncbi:YqgE/AlgH family protein [Pseudomaricurvus alkylphenolicus]|nr:YqgE/AlgH family protein [Pseudomaricurvus alkylphenolicus]NIB39609.1 YqgE/AlgH family protein [Pseudomaricurvus alkylphenolicus]